MSAASCGALVQGGSRRAQGPARHLVADAGAERCWSTARPAERQAAVVASLGRAAEGVQQAQRRRRRPRRIFSSPASRRADLARGPVAAARPRVVSWPTAWAPSSACLDLHAEASSGVRRSSRPQAWPQASRSCSPSMRPARRRPRGRPPSGPPRHRRTPTCAAERRPTPSGRSASTRTRTDGWRRQQQIRTRAVMSGPIQQARTAGGPACPTALLLVPSLPGSGSSSPASGRHPHDRMTARLPMLPGQPPRRGRPRRPAGRATRCRRRQVRDAPRPRRRRPVPRSPRASRSPPPPAGCATGPTLTYKMQLAWPRLRSSACPFLHELARTSVQTTVWEETSRHACPRSTSDPVQRSEGGGA